MTIDSFAQLPSHAAWQRQKHASDFSSDTLVVYVPGQHQRKTLRALSPVDRIRALCLGQSKTGTAISAATEIPRVRGKLFRI